MSTWSPLKVKLGLGLGLGSRYGLGESLIKKMKCRSCTFSCAVIMSVFVVYFNVELIIS